MPITDADEIEIVREIAGEPSYDTTAALCLSLNSAQTLAMQTDMVEWEAVRSDFTDLVGGARGISLITEDQRKAIRHRVRLRLGLSPFSEVEMGAQGIYLGSFSLGSFNS